MSNIESGITHLTPREKMTIPSHDDFNGAAARQLNQSRTHLRLVEPTKIIDQKVIPLRPVLKVDDSEVFEMNKDHVAPGAGERAKKIQRDGANRMDNEMEEYKRTGIFTQATARALGNTFIRLRAVGEGAGISNISQSAWIPEMQDSAQACSQLKKMGDKIAPKDAQIVEYGRLVMYVWDVDEIDYQKLFTNMADAPKVITSEFSPENEALELNKLQDRRGNEFKRKGAVFRDILEGAANPEIAAVPDGRDDSQDSLFLWGSKKVENKIYAINPDLILQDEEELGVTDMWTKGLLAHERDLTLSTPKGKKRLMLVLANDAYVRRCCVTVTNIYEKDFITNFVENTDKVGTTSSGTPFVYGDTVGAIYDDGKNYEVYHNNDYCSSCKSRKDDEGKCGSCSSEKSKSA